MVESIDKDLQLLEIVLLNTLSVLWMILRTLNISFHNYVLSLVYEMNILKTLQIFFKKAIRRIMNLVFVTRKVNVEVVFLCILCFVTSGLRSSFTVPFDCSLVLIAAERTTVNVFLRL